MSFNSVSPLSIIEKTAIKGMSFENPMLESKESEPKAWIEIESGFDGFVPEEFRHDPLEYFERKGRNIKSGGVEFDETGRVREDATAVKELPIWSDASGQELQVVAKRVNIEKGKVGGSGDPFYEFKIMEVVNRAGLPASRPVAKVEQQGVHLIVMEKVQGVGWYEKEEACLREEGYSEEDIENLKSQAKIMMAGLQSRYEEAGIIRGWKLPDMIFDIDVAGKKIKKITPVDWERTKIDQDKLEAYINRGRRKPEII